MQVYFVNAANYRESEEVFDDRNVSKLSHALSKFSVGKVLNDIGFNF